ncbi:MAG: ParA family protein [Bryobacterales bacterium]|nr:ParA family protein [Bryobacterales bacterium]
MDTRIIALANQKGGCGKTTTAVSLAAGFACQGYSASIIDLDPQCNATDGFGVDRDELTRAGRFTTADIFLGKKPASEIEVGFPNRFAGELGLVPGHRGLTSVPHRLESSLQAQLANDDSSELDADDLKNEHRERLKHSLNSLRGHRDVVFIDTPPDLGFLMTTALIAADYFIIPVFPSGYDLKGLETLMRTIEKVQRRFNPNLRLLGVLLGNYDTTAKLDSDIHKMLSRKFGAELIFDVKISRSVKHREATVYSRTIFEHAPEQQPSAQFLALVNEVQRRLNGITSSETPVTQAAGRA